MTNFLLEGHLNEIRETILMMASLADRNLRVALRALHGRDIALSRAVEADDSEIDVLEIALDEMVITCIATQRPVARDCRFMLVASKIAGSLERIGDQSATIARRVRSLCSEPPLTFVPGFLEISDLAQEMVTDAIKAFVDQRWDAAQEIIVRDKKVNEEYKKIANELSALVMQNSALGNRVVNSLAIAKAIERIADHAKHIAEQVYFLHRGQDIRHALLSEGWREKELEQSA